MPNWIVCPVASAFPDLPSSKIYTTSFVLKNFFDTSPQKTQNHLFSDQELEQALANYLPTLVTSKIGKIDLAVEKKRIKKNKSERNHGII